MSDDFEFNIVVPDDDDLERLLGKQSDGADTPSDGGIILPNADEVDEYSTPAKIAHAAAAMEEEARQMRAENLMRRKTGRPQLDGTYKAPKQSVLSGANPDGLAHKHSNTIAHTEIESPFLKGRISETVTTFRLHGKKAEAPITRFMLTAEPDYKKLWTANVEKKDDAENEDTYWLDFAQKRAGSFIIGHFASLEEAQSYLDNLDKMFMHVLAEQGAEGTLLSVANNRLSIGTNTEASNQKYSDALNTARVAHTFNRVAKNEPLSHDEALRYMMTVVHEVGIDCSIEPGSKGIYHTQDHNFIFDTDIGEFMLKDKGLSDTPGLVFIGTPPAARSEPQVLFEGEATAETLKETFTNRVAEAARSAGLIDENKFEKLHDGVSEIAGLPLHSNKLGQHSPF